MTVISVLACLGTTLSVLIPATFCIVYLFEGEACTQRDGSDGICGTFSDCGSAFSFPRNPPVLCSPRGLDDIICCPPEYIKKTTLPPTTPKPKPKEYEDTETCSLLMNRDPKEVEESLSGKACRMYRATHDRSSRSLGIIGGQVVTDMSTFPFMASLGYASNISRNGEIVTEIEYNCGGMLISDRFVLTAGHCENAQGPIVVKMGGTNKIHPDHNTKIFEVEKFIAHPCYNWSESYYDIALVKLTETISVTDYIFPACISMDPEPKVNRGYDVLGWGATDIGGNRLSESLLMTVVNIQHPDTCSLSWQPNNETLLPRGFAENTMICAINPDSGNATCRGDSGGPLSVRNSTIHYTVVGVISQGGTGCGDRDSPGLLTKIYPFLLWIEDVIWPDGKITPLKWDEGPEYYDDCEEDSEYSC